MMPPTGPQCYRHPGRATQIFCQRCRRPICGECMISAPVGFQCPECVARGARETRQNQGPYGGLRSANPSVTSSILIGINVAVWALLQFTGGYSSIWYHRLALSPVGICVLSSDPSQYLPGATASSCNAIDRLSWVPGVADGAWWQPITSAFSHVDILHIGFNMLALWFLGPQLERAIGRARFLALYLLSALAGSVVVMWFSDPMSSTLGASGAVFGLMGGLLMIGLKVRADVQPLLIWLGINAAYSLFGSGISWEGHLGGFLGGVAVAAIVAYAPRQHRLLVQVVSLVGFGVLCLGLIAVRALQLL